MNDDKETEVLQTIAFAWDMTLEEVRAESVGPHSGAIQRNS